MSIEEKPTSCKSHFAITGIYFSDNRAIEFAKQATFSARNELEITDIFNVYLVRQELTAQILEVDLRGWILAPMTRY